MSNDYSVNFYLGNFLTWKLSTTVFCFSVFCFFLCFCEWETSSRLLRHMVLVENFLEFNTISAISNWGIWKRFVLPLWVCIFRRKEMDLRTRLWARELLCTTKKVKENATPHLWLKFSYPLGNSFFPHLERPSAKSPLHIHPGKIQSEHCRVSFQTVRSAGGRWRADFPAELYCVWGKIFFCFKN